MTSPLNREELPDDVYYAVDAELTALVLRVVAPFDANLSVKNVKDRDVAVSRILKLIDQYTQQVAIEAKQNENRRWQKLVIDRQEIHSNSPYIHVLEYEERNEALEKERKQ